MKAVIAPLACLALASARLLPPREERPARALPAARDELPCGTPTTRGKVEFPDGMIVGGAGDFAMKIGQDGAAAWMEQRAVNGSARGGDAAGERGDSRRAARAHAARADALI